MENHKDYEFCIVIINKKFTYFIMDKEVDRKIKIVSDEFFEYEGRARFAAIGHIEILREKEIPCLND